MSRFWAVWCTAFALVVAVALVVLAGGDVVVCQSDLATVPEPAGWRSWPMLSKLGGFHIKADENCDEFDMRYGTSCPLENTELRTNDLCPRGGVSLDKWFDGETYQRSSIALHESHGTYVAAGEKDNGFLTVRDKPRVREVTAHGPVTPQVFLVAFRRHTTIVHPAFKHVWVMAVSFVLLVVLAFMIATGRTALLLRRRRRRYRDPAVYTRGVRDEAGTITFVDGTRSLVAPGPAGPVLVRLAPASEGGYRVEASEILEGELDGLCADLEGRAAAVVRRVGGWTFAVFVTVLLAFVVLYVSVLLTPKR